MQFNCTGQDNREDNHSSSVPVIRAFSVANKDILMAISQSKATYFSDGYS